MKKIPIIFSVLLTVFMVSSCKDDEINPYSLGKTISVVSQSVIFDAPAATGTVVVESDGGSITAAADAPWATVSVSGNTVNVSVTENDNINGRSSQLTIKNGADSVNVTIQQHGFIFRLNANFINFGDDAQEKSFDLTHNTDVSISTSADWLTAAIDGDTFKVAVTANDTKHLRAGYVYYTAGTYTDSIRVAQYEFEKDLAGDCILLGTNMSDGKKVGLKATFSYDKATSKYVLDLPEMTGWKIHLGFSSDVPSASLYAGDRIGEYNGNHVFSTLLDLDAGYLSWSSSISISGAFQYDEAEKVTYVNFADNGSWPGYNVTAFCFELFTSTKPTGSTRKGLLLGVAHPMLLRFNPE
ncbi:MAG: BACON domain-containing protein [Bacteroidales bacterium]|nr:BACON domain-containing protein [Bacteroidales bacterium]MDY6002666.1 BACON domain-containing protein [Candidatus Cryptobacteroides sp.]